MAIELRPNRKCAHCMGLGFEIEKRRVCRCILEQITIVATVSTGWWGVPWDDRYFPGEIKHTIIYSEEGKPDEAL